MYLCHHFECVQLTKLRILDLQLAIVLADIELTTGKRIETFYVSHVSIYENIFTHFSLSMILTIHLKFKWMFFFFLSLNWIQNIHKQTIVSLFSFFARFLFCCSVAGYSSVFHSIADNFRPYLTSFQGNAFTDYINAVFVDVSVCSTFQKRKKKTWKKNRFVYVCTSVIIWVMSVVVAVIVVQNMFSIHILNEITTNFTQS